ncbi:helix-turn-helix transcriptional regulator [Saxibacter everestensis]|uniref:Helix-turn-helix transcriptional regulator n=1 Tax=Saxibacter everestensis TaxID=2909229 RepID=A0ABY8QT72_9MICO|nr:helix-turn-helix transcriptional regulator [Brevibacteriaceae bacterium ZFBP1038]
MFGQTLKEARKARGLTQAQLAGDTYSASYISLLESGRRRPNESIVRDLAVRLNVSPADLMPGSVGALSSMVELVEIEADARQAFRAKQVDKCSQLAEDGARLAKQESFLGIWWNLSYLRAENLLEAGAYDACLTQLTRMREDPVVNGSSLLLGRVETMMSTAHLGAGSIAQSLHFAHLAIADLVHADHNDALARAYMALIAALQESGQTGEAQKACTLLVELIDRIESREIAGKAHWVAGNVAMLSGDVGEGTEHHERAEEYFSPRENITLWGQFHKAAADMRVRSGHPEVAWHHYREAEKVLSLLGSEREKLELALVEARLYFAAGSDEQAVPLLRRIADTNEPTFPTQARGEAEELLADAAFRAGDQQGARLACLRAVTHFEDAGAHERAVEQRRRANRYGGMPVQPPPNRTSQANN